jgi:hypothetical protein
VTELTGRSFYVHGPENAKMNEFIKGHRSKHGPEQTAIGGRFKFSFIPTSIGVVQEISCEMCDDKLDVTDYDSW